MQWAPLLRLADKVSFLHYPIDRAVYAYDCANAMRNLFDVIRKKIDWCQRQLVSHFQQRFPVPWFHFCVRQKLRETKNQEVVVSTQVCVVGRWEQPSDWPEVSSWHPPFLHNSTVSLKTVRPYTAEKFGFQMSRSSPVCQWRTWSTPSFAQQWNGLTWQELCIFRLHDNRNRKPEMKCLRALAASAP